MALYINIEAYNPVTAYRYAFLGPLFDLYFTEYAKTHLRESEGLTLLLELLTSTTCQDIKEALMFCLGCAVDKNGNIRFL